MPNTHHTHSTSSKTQSAESSVEGGSFFPLSKDYAEKINNSYAKNALRMMRGRYLQPKDDEGEEYEMPAEMLTRIARSLASVEKRYGKNQVTVERYAKQFFEIMERKEFTPAGRTVANAGADTALVANCIVLPVEDSMDGIFQTLKDAALLQQVGSGLGFDFSYLRPALSPTKRTQGVASGPVEFLKVYDTAFGIIQQQQRKGANMGMMRIDHPDVLDFIRAKEREGDIWNFNISVQLTDEFLNAVENNPDEQWYCKWKGEKMKPRTINRGARGRVTSVEEADITAKELFDEIVEYAWLNGEPGVFFVDQVNRVSNPLPGLGPITCTNPCGEQPLHPYDNCNLGSINLSAFVKDNKVDWDRLKETTRRAVRMMDNVIDLFDFPVEKVTALAKKNRRIGLGVMGFADMLFKLRIPYDSQEGRKIAEKTMETINKTAHEMSQELAQEKGVFPNIEESVYGAQYGERYIPMRNAALTTIAPTGSISMMLDCSSGIEPDFALSFTKQDGRGEKYQYLNPLLLEALEEHGFSESEIEEVKQEVLEKGSIQHLDHLPEEIRRTFVVSMDISARDHMAMQAAFQRHVDNSISKTINFPNSATKEDIAEGYISAWKMGCLSCTVYRDGSREVQVMSVGDGEDMKSMQDYDPQKEKEKKENETTTAQIQKDQSAPKTEDQKKQNSTNKEKGSASSGSASQGTSSTTNGFHAKDRPNVLGGRTYRVRTGYGNMYITINNDRDGRPFEVFATIGKAGGFFQEQTEAICRMISTALRANVSVKEIIEQLKGIRGPHPTISDSGDTIHSLPDAIGQILEEHIGENQKHTQELFEAADQSSKVESNSAAVEQEETPQPVLTGTVTANENKSIADYGFMPGCPECGGSLRMAEGCMSCPSCGFSRCG